MNQLRVFDQHGRLIRAFENVVRYEFDHYGVLTIERADATPENCCVVYYNPRVWGSVEDWELPAEQLPVEQLPAEQLPVEQLPQRVPAERDPASVADPLAQPDALRLRDAMQIHCVCASLRCSAGRSSERRCNLLVLHQGTHRFDGPPWEYGPHNHHQNCPRHPATYNAHTGPCGAQYTEAGEPVAGMTCVLPYLHDGDHAVSARQFDELSRRLDDPLVSHARGLASVPPPDDPGGYLYEHKGDERGGRFDGLVDVDPRDVVGYQVGRVGPTDAA